MSVNESRVLAEALALSAEERAELATELLQSLEAGAPGDIEQRDRAWAAEIERRCAQLDSGHATTMDWSEARQRIERELPGK